MKNATNPLLTRKYPFKAEFYDVDSMGVMWHGNYVKYLESARCKLLDEISFNYLDMQKANFSLPVIKMDFKYINPIFFNDDFLVEIRLLEFESILRFEYLFLKNNLKLSLAHTSQVAFKMDTKETCYVLPPAFTKAIEAFIKTTNKGE